MPNEDETSFDDQAMIERIINLRESRNWTQKDLADRMGMNKVTMNKIENHNRAVTSAELAKFAEVLDTTADYLLGQNNTPAWATEKDTLDLKDVLDGKVQPSFNFGGEDISDDDRAKLNLAITQIFWEKLEKQRKRAERDGK